MALSLNDALRDHIIGRKQNLLTNGTFTSDATGWTGSGATPAASGGEGVITNSGAAKGVWYEDFTTIANRAYCLTFEGKVGTASGFSVRVGSTSDDDVILQSPVYTDSTMTEHRVAFIATGTTTRISLVNESTTSGHTVNFDNVVLDAAYDGVLEILRGFKIALFAGTKPANANLAATGSTLLCTAGANLNTSTGAVDGAVFNYASTGSISNTSISGKAVATGTAAWARVYVEGDDPASASTVYPRFDGTVAVSGADFTVSSVSVVSGAIQTVSSASFTMPGA